MINFHYIEPDYFSFLTKQKGAVILVNKKIQKQDDTAKRDL
jgi:hypothetical protein